jgi:hypothetical protein
MDIVIGRTAGVSRDGTNKRDPSWSAKNKQKEDRRKNKQDRRKSVRDGVVVTLSTKQDRRAHRDRRRKSKDPGPEGPALLHPEG